MRDLAVVQTGEAALRSLGVRSRVVPLSGGALFFCDCGGLTFDLLLGPDASSRVWKLLSTDTAAQVGTQLVCQNPSCPQEEVGFSVEEEGVVSCYSVRSLGGADDPVALLTHQLNWFLQLLGRLRF